MLRLSGLDHSILNDTYIRNKIGKLYLVVLDQDKVLEHGQVDGVGLVLHRLLIVDLGNELALLNIADFIILKQQ